MRSSGSDGVAEVEATFAVTGDEAGVCARAGEAPRVAAAPANAARVANSLRVIADLAVSFIRHAPSGPRTGWRRRRVIFAEPRQPARLSRGAGENYSPCVNARICVSSD